MERLSEDNEAIENISDSIACSFIGEKARRAKEGDVDREIHQAIARAAEDEIDRQWIEWGESFCVADGHYGLDKRANTRKRECRQCWQIHKQQVEKEK